MSQLSSKVSSTLPEIFEAEKGLMALKYESGMGLEAILEAFWVQRAQQSEAGREVLTRNKFKIAEWLLAREDGRSISPRTMVYIPNKFVSKKAPAPTGDSPRETVIANPVQRVDASAGIMATYRAEFHNLMQDRSSRIALYAGAVLSVAIGVSAAVGISMMTKPHPKSVKVAIEDSDEEEAQDEPRKKTNGWIVQVAEGAAEPPVRTPSSPSRMPLANKPVKVTNGVEFVFSSNSKASDLKAAIDEFNALDKKKAK